MSLCGMHRSGGSTPVELIASARLGHVRRPRSKTDLDPHISHTTQAESIVPNKLENRQSALPVAPAHGSFVIRLTGWLTMK